MKKFYHTNNKQRKLNIAMLISDKTDVKLESIIKDKRGSPRNDKRFG